MESFWQYVIRQFNNTFIRENRYRLFIDGFTTTLEVAFFAVIIGVVMGVVIAVVKVYHYRTGNARLANALMALYTTIFRGTPVVVQLMIWYYVILTFANGVTAAIIGFGLNSAAYVSEIVRAGILSIDKGQSEAGRSLGLTEIMTMRHIVLPQAIKNTLPALFNEFITLLKETSVAGYVSVIDLAKVGDLVRSRTLSPFFPLFSVALIYLVLVVGLTALQGKLERKLQKSDRR
ncbi:MAG: amino acid ABC transporter permease [Clostridiales Family XIII bacterium]|jgi:His/Glu/Gln/Arg/opine family amino acid ABC transporter permease subunit|nr:amino acid ABC transporter permease [Clostridiales Family XIII bacterium]